MSSRKVLLKRADLEQCSRPAFRGCSICFSLFWLRIFAICLRPLRQMLGYYLIDWVITVRPRSFKTTIIIILPFEAIVLILKTSLHSLRKKIFVVLFSCIRFKRLGISRPCCSSSIIVTAYFHLCSCNFVTSSNVCYDD